MRSESITLTCPRCGEERPNPRAVHPPDGFISIHLTTSPEPCGGCTAHAGGRPVEAPLSQRETSMTYRGGGFEVVAKIDPREAESAPCAPLVDLVSDARLREIANGVDIEIGPWAEVGAAERFAAELHTMAAELLAVRAELSRLALDCQRWLTESDDRPNLRAAENRVRLLARGSR